MRVHRLFPRFQNVLNFLRGARWIRNIVENAAGLKSLQVRPQRRSFTLPVFEGPGQVVATGDRVPKYRIAKLLSIQGWRPRSRSSMASISLPATGPRPSFPPPLARRATLFIGSACGVSPKQLDGSRSTTSPCPVFRRLWTRLAVSFALRSRPVGVLLRLQVGFEYRHPRLSFGARSAFARVPACMFAELLSAAFHYRRAATYIAASADRPGCRQPKRQ